MNAPANFPTKGITQHLAPPTRYTAEQAEALIRAAELETDLRLRLAGDSFTERLSIKRYLADVTRLAVEVLDDLAGEGFEGAHEELADELEAVNVHRLWTAIARPEAFLAEDYFAPVRVAPVGGVS